MPFPSHVCTVACGLQCLGNRQAFTVDFPPVTGMSTIIHHPANAGLVGAANLEGGKTNTHGALMFPFGIDPAEPPAVGAKTGKASVKNKLDTVFFLSDGRPSTGRLVDTREILKEVARINQAYRVVFHTIAIGDFQKNFLRDLATQNGGVFVDLGR